MSNKKKKNKKIKKVLDGVDIKDSKTKSFNDVLKDIKEDIKEEEFKKGKKIFKVNNKNNKSKDVNLEIQNFISILFTIIIFIALILLIVVLYNNYLNKEVKVNKDEVCKEYIKKDYNIDKDKIIEFIGNMRGIIYNINDINDFNDDTNLEIIKYLIWSSDGDYIPCSEEEKCLVSKKMMTDIDIKNSFESYFGVSSLNLDFIDDKVLDENFRIYKENDLVTLTFNEFIYYSLKHDIVDIRIDSDNIEVLFSLSEKIDNLDYYNYIGYKKLTLKYIDNHFIIKKINSNINK